MYSLEHHLVDNREDVNATLTGSGETVLHLVAADGSQAELARGVDGAAELTALPFVLSLAPDLEAPNAATHTPLMHAALTLGEPALPAVDALVAAGADIDARSSSQTNRTALMLESIDGDHAMMRALLARGANVSLADDSGLTAMDHAIWRCSPDNLEVFLDMNATTVATRNQALRWACHQCGFLGNGVEILDGILVRTPPPPPTPPRSARPRAHARR